MTQKEAIDYLTPIAESARLENYAAALKLAIDALRAQAAPPPNDPLTLEQLLEMGGEPVWVERPGYGKNWALVNVWAKSTNIIYLTCNNGMVLHPQPELDSGAKIYRRKPEEGTHEH